MNVPAPKLRIELPDHERGRSPDDLRRFDRLQRKLRKPDLTDKQRAEIVQALAELESAPRLRDDAAWLARSQVESSTLAQIRGAEVGTDGNGVKRVLDHDPLLSLARGGHLSPAQLDAGTAVRDLYDRRSEDAGAVEYTGLPGGAHQHERFVAARFSRAKACEMIGRIERAVAVNCSTQPACLAMLRIVCERGHALSSQGKGRAFERHAAALARALDVAEDVLARRL